MFTLAVLRPNAAAAVAHACAPIYLRAALLSGQSQEPQQPHTGGLRDDPGHELATGGLYESARKDREAVPSPVPGVINQATANQATDTAAPEQATMSQQGLPTNSYPLHKDPAASLQHPSEAFRGPAQAERSQPPPADRDVEGAVSPSSDVEARADVHGVTRGSPPEDVQQGQVGVAKPPSSEQIQAAQRS